MNCNRCRQELPDLLRGALADEHRVAVESHLSRCADCGVRRDALASLFATLDDHTARVGPMPRAARFSADLRARMEQPRRRRPSPYITQLLVPTLAAAVILLVTLVGLPRVLHRDTHALAVNEMRQLVAQLDTAQVAALELQLDAGSYPPLLDDVLATEDLHTPTLPNTVNDDLFGDLGPAALLAQSTEYLSDQELMEYYPSELESLLLESTPNRIHQ
jgi:hypothetical protein